MDRIGRQAVVITVMLNHLNKTDILAEIVQINATKL